MNCKSRSYVKFNKILDLEALADLGREALMTRWRELYGVAPPRKISQQLLFQAAAYRLQELETGGIKPATRRFLERAVKVRTDGEKATPLVSAKPGTRLLREWHGLTYEATLLEDGVLFQGKKYRSLSEVARAITGVRWSGPLFFGLKKKSAEKGNFS